MVNYIHEKTKRRILKAGFHKRIIISSEMLIISTFCWKFSLGGAVASWLYSASSSDRAVLVGALTGDIVLCSWERHFTLTVPPSTQVYK